MAVRVSDAMLPETCECGIAWDELPDDHSAVMDPVSLRMQCPGTVGQAKYERLRRMSGIL